MKRLITITAMCLIAAPASAQTEDKALPALQATIEAFNQAETDMWTHMRPAAAALQGNDVTTFCHEMRLGYPKLQRLRGLTAEIIRHANEAGASSEALAPYVNYADQTDKLNEKAEILVPQHCPVPASVIDEKMAGLHADPFYGLLFQAHPDAEKEARAGLEKIVVMYPPDEVEQAFHPIAVAILNTWLNPHYLTTSDTALNALLTRNAVMMKALQAQPEACVAYYTTNSQIPDDMLTPEFIESEVRVKIDILKASLEAPQSLKDPLSQDAITARLKQTYQKAGFDPAELSRLGKIASLPLEDGCRVGTHFTIALISDTATENARLYKSLMSLP